MTRRKKSKTGSFQEVVVTKNRNRLDYEGRLRKKQGKKKGLRPGNRNSQENIINSVAPLGSPFYEKFHLSR